MSRSTRMLIKAGIIPKNVLEHLAGFRLIPEDYVKLHGKAPVTLDTQKPEDVESFVSGLGEALAKDMSEIRETNLDSAVTGNVDVQLRFKDGRTEDAYLPIDLMGRLVVPADPQWEDLESVVFVEKNQGAARAVVRQETRFEGETPCSKVIYLAKE